MLVCKYTCIKDQYWISEDKDTFKVLTTNCTDLEDIVILYSV